MKRAAQQGPVAKTRSWKLTSILSLGLTGLGAMGVIELRPQMAVSPLEPIEKSQPFSVPFRIENTGYLSFLLVRPFCYYHQVNVERLTVKKATSHAAGTNRHVLDRNESETISCNLAHAPIAPAHADIAVVIDYTPWRWQLFPYTFRKYFRFKGAYVDNWQWTPQPSGEIQKDADFEVEDHMNKIPSSR
jgi:hypothetical protein